MISCVRGGPHYLKATELSFCLRVIVRSTRSRSRSPCNKEGKDIALFLVWIHNEHACSTSILVGYYGEWYGTCINLFAF